MVAMGGGADLPLRDLAEEKEIVLCTLLGPEERAKKAVAELKKEFDDIKILYYETKWENGKLVPLHVPEGTYEYDPLDCCTT